MDADYDNTNIALSQTLSWVATSLNTDGSLKAGSVGQSQLVSGLFDDIAQDIIDEVQPLVDQAQGYAASAAGSSTTAQAAATAADASNTAAGGAASTATTAAATATAARNTAQGYATTAQTAATQAQNADNDATGAAALAQDYADVTQAWAEHMPDTIPPNILAVMGVTGDHWSSRWWANEAANTFGGRQLMQSLLYRAAANQTVFPLTTPDLGGKTYTVSSIEPVEVFVNGVKLPPDDPNPGNGDWTLNATSSTVTFLTPLLAGSMVQIDVMSPRLGSLASITGAYLPLSGGILEGAPGDDCPILCINHTGSGNAQGVLQVNLTPTDFSVGTFPWAITSNITLNGSGQAQPVGITSTVTRNSGGSPAFCYYAQILDNTGGAYLNPATGLNGPTGGVPFECDFFTNGPEPSTVFFNPNSGGRAVITIGMAAQLFPQWAASQPYTIGTIINPFNTTRNPNASVYAYKALSTGTSGVTEPVFPLTVGATVTDGGVTWQCFTPYVPQVSRGLQIGGGSSKQVFRPWAAGTTYAPGATINPVNTDTNPSAGLYNYQTTAGGMSDLTEPVFPLTIGATVIDGGVTWTCLSTYQTRGSRAGQCAAPINVTNLSVIDAIIETTHGVTMAKNPDGSLINPNVAAIRLQPNWPIDFSGSGGSGGQNVRTLAWNSSTNCFEYRISTNPTPVALSVHDAGVVGIGGDVPAGTHPTQLYVLGTNTVGASTALGTFTTGLRLGSDQRLSLEATDAHYLQYRAATQRLYYVVAGVDMWSVDASGNVRARGTLTGSITP